MILISIDGACRRNGKPDCVSAGGAFIKRIAPDRSMTKYASFTESECGSTNQRGELLALINALQYLSQEYDPEGACIITDSEYLFNALNKEWIRKWAANKWKLVSGEPVKNADLWRRVYKLLSNAKDRSILHDLTYYHIKGHCIPFGAVTSDRLLDEDPTGGSLYNSVCDKYDSVASSKKDTLRAANKLSERNNGFAFSDEHLKSFVAMNVTADAIATKAVNLADCTL